MQKEKSKSRNDNADAPKCVCGDDFAHGMIYSLANIIWTLDEFSIMQILVQLLYCAKIKVSFFQFGIDFLELIS